MFKGILFLRRRKDVKELDEQGNVINTELEGVHDFHSMFYITEKNNFHMVISETIDKEKLDELVSKFMKEVNSTLDRKDTLLILGMYTNNNLGRLVDSNTKTTGNYNIRSTDCEVNVIEYLNIFLKEANKNI